MEGDVLSVVIPADKEEQNLPPVWRYTYDLPRILDEIYESMAARVDGGAASRR
jgi:hypothetical protein